MTEKTPDRRMTLTRAAQDPLRYLRANKQRGKTCAESIHFLRDVRTEIRDEANLKIEKPNLLFAQYFRSSNDQVEHYVALFTLLKEAGFQKHEVQSALMDDFPVRTKSVSSDPGSVARRFFAITNEALGKVFEKPAS